MQLFRSPAAFVVLALSLLPNPALAHQPATDPAQPDLYFREAQALSDRDHGQLWGLPLAGPMLLADPKTRRVIANQPDRDGVLSPVGPVFTGQLPANINIANTATDWAGQKWTMLILPLPNDPQAPHARANLIAHELWHRIQPDLGFPSSGAANNHLDSRAGRVWLQLEWRALAAALMAQGDPRLHAAADALLFRTYRRQLFAGAGPQEREMEMHEGLAEYTGVKLCGAPELNKYVAEGNLKNAPRNPTFIRSFAYASGPAYGLLLDDTGSPWRKTLKKDDDLGLLLQTTLGLIMPANIPEAAQARAKVYDGDSLLESETQRDLANQKIIATNRARFVDGPVLAIALHQMNMQFNPGNLVPLDTLGTIYPNIRIVDTWGILTAANGALMSPTYSNITVVAPADLAASPLKGDGWTLELNPGWTIVPADRPGDYTLKPPK